MGIFDGVMGGQGGLASASGAAGQFKESTEDELQRQHLAMQANVYSQQLAQSMKNAKHAAIQGVYQQAMTPFNPNDIEAYTVPMSNLVTLWQAKYGDTWVETSQEEFWQHALKRLSLAGKMEQVSGWYRMKEDA